MRYPYPNHASARAARAFQTRVARSGIILPDAVVATITGKLVGAADHTAILAEAAKIAADLPAEGFPVDKNLALEAIAAFRGARNWATLNASLKRPRAPARPGALGPAPAPQATGPDWRTGLLATAWDPLSLPRRPGSGLKASPANVAAAWASRAAGKPLWRIETRWKNHPSGHRPAPPPVPSSVLPPLVFLGHRTVERGGVACEEWIWAQRADCGPSGRRLTVRIESGTENATVAVTKGYGRSMTLIGSGRPARGHAAAFTEGERLAAKLMARFPKASSQSSMPARGAALALVAAGFRLKTTASPSGDAFSWAAERGNCRYTVDPQEDPDLDSLTLRHVVRLNAARDDGQVSSMLFADLVDALRAFRADTAGPLPGRGMAA